MALHGRSAIYPPGRIGGVNAFPARGPSQAPLDDAAMSWLWWLLYALLTFGGIAIVLAFMHPRH
jgi:hypothetical protein